MSQKSRYPKAMPFCLFGFAFLTQFWPLDSSAVGGHSGVPGDPQKPVCKCEQLIGNDMSLWTMVG